MELARALDDLDARPWSVISHAYGSAEDLPDVLRALAGTDPSAADEAVTELYGSVLHQGTVYAASAEVVPFLARIAASGHRTADVLELLGGMAQSEDEHGVTPGTVRAAVAEQLPLLLPMLDAVEPGVRRRAAWAVAHTRAVDSVLPPLRACWDRESAAPVRAELLTGISRLDPALGAALAATVLDMSHPAELRMAAVFTALDADSPWTDAHHTTMLSLLPADPLMADHLDLERNEPLAAVVEMLLSRNGDAGREAACVLLDAGLRDERAEVRAEAVWAADRACMLSRSAPKLLLPGLVSTAVDDRAVVAVASLLGRLGSAAAQAAPVLAPLAGRNPDQDDDLADRALAALVPVAPVQAAPLLARGLGRRPRTLDAAAGFRVPGDSAFPYDGELLDAARSRLSRPGDLCGNEPRHLTSLLAGWGARAAEALPELYAALAHFPGQAARAITSIAAASVSGERARAARELRAAATNGSLPAAKALYDLTGEDRLLLNCLTRRLADGSRELREAAGTAGALGPRAASLAPALRAALSEVNGSAVIPVLDADTAVAEALWRITEDATVVVTTLDSVFTRAAQSPWSQWSAVRAARVAALLGPSGRPLTPRLKSLLGDPVQAPAAALALAAVADPGSLDRTALATVVLDSAEREADPMGACDALAALGAGALTPDHLRRLSALAEGDPRVIRSGVENRIIRQDEAFQDRARELLAALTDHAGP
ncbi:hypothetical protein [Streptomyces sp. NBC_00316]|uniref:hypothetical protein n=1 Tax=Streptomyces sp. NBC_00316 TaxID=2975710 RepID=UPI002E2C94F7|nr:hypothetical protein [Streptomyces sp. NBC_00316]